MTTVFFVTMETRNFTFTAAGRTREEALTGLQDAILRHAVEYKLPTDWAADLDASAVEMEVGKGYRDGELCTMAKGAA